MSEVKGANAGENRRDRKRWAFVFFVFCLMDDETTVVHTGKEQLDK